MIRLIECFKLTAVAHALKPLIFVSKLQLIPSVVFVSIVVKLARLVHHARHVIQLLISALLMARKDLTVIVWIITPKSLLIWTYFALNATDPVLSVVAPQIINALNVRIQLQHLERQSQTQIINALAWIGTSMMELIRIVKDVITVA